MGAEVMVPSATSSAITIVRLRRVAQVEIRISDPSQILWFWMGGDTRFTRPPTPRFLSPLAPPARICLHGSRRTRNDQRPEPARVTGCHIRHHSRHDRRLQPRSDYGRWFPLASIPAGRRLPSRESAATPSTYGHPPRRCSPPTVWVPANSTRAMRTIP